jgi:predicted Zn finger-like uncharacterized protein
MYTQCPDCQTRFRVTANALRAAHGTVRCGRCGSAFDALPRLSDTLPPPQPAPTPLLIAAATSLVPVAPVASEPLASHVEIDLSPIIEAELAALAARDVTPDAVPEPAAVVVDEGGAGEDITLEGEGIRVDGVLDAGTPESGPPPDAELEFDLDATDRFEALRLENAPARSERDFEREFEALLQRLQRDFDSAAVDSAAPAAGPDDTAVLPALPDLEFRPDAAAAPDPAVAAADEPQTPASTAPEPLDPVGETVYVEVLAGQAVPALVVTTAAPAASWPAAATPTGPETAPVDVTARGTTTDPAAEWTATPAAIPAPLPTAASAGVVTEAAEIPAPDVAVSVPPPAPPAAARVPEPPPAERPLAAQRWRPMPVDEELPPPPARSPWRTLAWSLGCLALVLVLAAQLVHRNRDMLVRDPRLGTPLRDLYARAGTVLPPARDVSAFELRQWGDDERGSGHMRMRVRVTNQAEFAQPHPVLRLELEDRYGASIATRDFEPTEYLASPATAAEPMAPGASSEAELMLADPGADAVGYRLDACLRESAETLRCAQATG